MTRSFKGGRPIRGFIAAEVVSGGQTRISPLKSATSRSSSTRLSAALAALAFGCGAKSLLSGGDSLARLNPARIRKLSPGHWRRRARDQLIQVGDLFRLMVSAKLGRTPPSPCLPVHYVSPLNGGPLPINPL